MASSTRLRLIILGSVGLGLLAGCNDAGADEDGHQPTTFADRQNSVSGMLSGLESPGGEDVCMQAMIADVLGSPRPHALVSLDPLPRALDEALREQGIPSADLEIRILGDTHVILASRDPVEVTAPSRQPERWLGLAYEFVLLDEWAVVESAIALPCGTAG